MHLAENTISAANFKSRLAKIPSSVRNPLVFLLSFSCYCLPLLVLRLLQLLQVLGLVGTNGIGKSTALKILAGKLKPNLGRFESPPDWQEILQHFRGSELQNYFTRILEDNLKVCPARSPWCW